MDSTEKPLLEMMKWSEGDREGRFLLINELSMSMFRGNKRSVSPRKVKKAPKSPKEKRKPKTRSRGGKMEMENGRTIYEDDSVADTLYENYPSSKFTRSITNPEIVKNLWNSTADKRLRSSYQAIDELDSEESSVPIITESLLPSKTILATNNDSAAQIVRTAVEKFRLDADPNDFCLVEVMLPSISGSGSGSGRHSGGGKGERVERVLSDDESPVKLHTRWMLGEPGVVNRNVLQFQLRRRTSFTDRLKSPQPVFVETQHHELPCLINLSHPTSSGNHRFQKKHTISSFPVEIGSRVFLLNPESHICLLSQSIAPKHCVISHTYRGTYMIQPLDDKAMVAVNDQSVKYSTPLPLDSIIKFSEHDMFKFTVSNHSLHSRSNSALTDHVTEKSKDRLGKAYSTDNLAPTANEKVLLSANNN